MTAPGLPTEEQYARNLVGGQWRFPAAPYEFEVRSPLDSSVIAVVPLSSRFDVARAVEAARAVAPSWAADAPARLELLGRLVDEIELLAEPLAAVQSRESGLTPPDSRRAIDAAAAMARTLVTRAPTTRTLITDVAGGGIGRLEPGVSGHVLSWGLPFVEVICGALTELVRGRSVVVKPSLRAPMSATAFGHLVTRLGFPDGVVNVVQGTGIDVGAAVCGTRDLAALLVRGGERTLAQASRAVRVTGAPLHTLRAGGNVAVVGPDADPAAVAAAIRDAVRVHSAGGPLGLPLLAVADTVSATIVDAVLAGLRDCAPAPLPTEPLRQRALARIATLERDGAYLVAGGSPPDDIRHRMGWVLPPTVLTLGDLARLGGATDGDALGEPIGPVLTIGTWRSPADLATLFGHPRFEDGAASLFGLSEKDVQAAKLPHRLVRPRLSPHAGMVELLPAVWTPPLPPVSPGSRTIADRRR